GRNLFVVVAALVALQRIECGAHFVSDTLWGAALAYGYCAALYHPALLGQWFAARTRGLREWSTGSPAATPVAPASMQTASAFAGFSNRDRSDSSWPRTFALRSEENDSRIRSLSVVIPLLDEEENLALLHASLSPVLQEVGLPFEIIFVDDGSRDGSPDELRR